MGRIYAQTEKLSDQIFDLVDPPLRRTVVGLGGLAVSIAGALVIREGGPVWAGLTINTVGNGGFLLPVIAGAAGLERQSDQNKNGQQG